MGRRSVVAPRNAMAFVEDIRPVRLEDVEFPRATATGLAPIAAPDIVTPDVGHEGVPIVMTVAVNFTLAP